jgi:hypothetical protein
MAKTIHKREKQIKEVLTEAYDIFISRNSEYGDAAAMHGDVMNSLFPNGITLNNPNDFRRYTYISGVIGKLTRYCNNFNNGGHKDSTIDPINMLAMLSAFDKELENENS